jgi:tRNA threonylcarbamoyl adenosine modification protein (Sua5/YciO/YrdC/YwlC family)
MRLVQLDDLIGDAGARSGIVRSIRSGRVFIYPTDTVYGIGCDATTAGPVRRIREMKGSRSPFSVIAPSREWITRNLVVPNPRYLDRLPGPYTLILKVRKRGAVSEEVSGRTLGVRIPDHPFTGIVQEAGVPFVTTSANMSGESPVWTIQGIPEHMERSVDIAVDGGVINHPPSSVLDLTGPRARKIR